MSNDFIKDKVEAKAEETRVQARSFVARHPQAFLIAVIVLAVIVVLAVL